MNVQADTPIYPRRPSQTKPLTDVAPQAPTAMNANLAGPDEHLVDPEGHEGDQPATVPHMADPDAAAPAQPPPVKSQGPSGPPPPSADVSDHVPSCRLQRPGADVAEADGPGSLRRRRPAPTLSGTQLEAGTSASPPPSGTPSVVPRRPSAASTRLSEVIPVANAPGPQARPHVLVAPSNPSPGPRIAPTIPLKSTGSGLNRSVLPAAASKPVTRAAPSQGASPAPSPRPTEVATPRAHDLVRKADAADQHELGRKALGRNVETPRSAKKSASSARSSRPAVKPAAKPDDLSSGLNDELSAAEKTDLRRHEAIIRRGLGTFYTVGKALAEIRDRRLYRQTHPTFEAYCRSRWEMGVRRVHQLCGAAEVIDSLQNVNNCSHLAGAADGQQSATATHQVPTNEAQARVLSTLPPAERSLVWQQAVAVAPEGKPTARLIQRIIRERAPAQQAAAGDPPADQTDMRTANEKASVPATGGQQEAGSFDLGLRCKRLRLVVDQEAEAWLPDHHRELLAELTKIVKELSSDLREC